MSSLLVRVDAVSTALAGLLIIGQEAWALPTGGVIAEGRVESAVHTTQMLLLVVGIGLGVALNGTVPGVLAVYGAAMVWLAVAALQRSGRPAARQVEAGLAAG